MDTFLCVFMFFIRRDNQQRGVNSSQIQSLLHFHYKYTDLLGFVHHLIGIIVSVMQQPCASKRMLQKLI